MTRFQRLVLEVGHGAADPATLRQAATFARLLDVELHALFVEDDSLSHASALPFAREISALSLQWRELAHDRLRDDLRADAERTRRHVDAAARAIGIVHHFEVRQGDVSLHIDEVCVATDIVVVSPPRGAGAAAAHGFRRLRDTAHRGVASVLFLPARPIRARGAILAVVSGPDDPALAVAERIAAQAGDRVVAVQALDQVSGMAERLIVLTQDRPGDAADLAAARGVPVLVLRPA